MFDEPHLPFFSLLLVLWSMVQSARRWDVSSLSSEMPQGDAGIAHYLGELGPKRGGSLTRGMIRSLNLMNFGALGEASLQIHFCAGHLQPNRCRVRETEPMRPISAQFCPVRGAFAT